MMKKSTKILIPVIVVIVLAVLCILYGPLLYNQTPDETGWITYKPIDENPAGQTAVVLTEADFALHPAFSFIFGEDGQIQTIALTLDKDATEVPNPKISERAGYAIINGYPYVEYDGQLYKCDWVFT